MIELLGNLPAVLPVCLPDSAAYPVYHFGKGLFKVLIEFIGGAEPLAECSVLPLNFLFQLIELLGRGSQVCRETLFIF